MEPKGRLRRVPLTSVLAVSRHPRTFAVARRLGLSGFASSNIDGLQNENRAAILRRGATVECANRGEIQSSLTRRRCEGVMTGVTGLERPA
jgi:hypothetical protein